MTFPRPMWNSPTFPGFPGEWSPWQVQNNHCQKTIMHEWHSEQTRLKDEQENEMDAETTRANTGCAATSTHLCTERRCSLRPSQVVSRALLHRFIHLHNFLVYASLTAGAAEQLREHLRQLRQTLFRIQDSHCLLHLLQYNSLFVLMTKVTLL